MTKKMKARALIFKRMKAYAEVTYNNEKDQIVLLYNRRLYDTINILYEIGVISEKQYYDYKDTARMITKEYLNSRN